MDSSPPSLPGLAALSSCWLLYHPLPPLPSLAITHIPIPQSPAIFPYSLSSYFEWLEVTFSVVKGQSWRLCFLNSSPFPNTPSPRKKKSLKILFQKVYRTQQKRFESIHTEKFYQMLQCWFCIFLSWPICAEGPPSRYVIPSVQAPSIILEFLQKQIQRTQEGWSASISWKMLFMDIFV